MKIGDRIRVIRPKDGLTMFEGREGNIVSRADVRGKFEPGLIPVSLDDMGIFGFHHEEIIHIPVGHFLHRLGV